MVRDFRMALDQGVAQGVGGLFGKGTERTQLVFIQGLPAKGNAVFIGICQGSGFIKNYGIHMR